MTATGKDTIYIDIDDEITSIIDKVRSSTHQIVALVLPKRAAMLQSSVNMKLLKRAADSAKKHLVLVTTEASLLQLAGDAGLFVAKTPQSKPEVPDGAKLNTAADDALSIDEPPEEEFDPSQAADKPIGALAGLPLEEAMATPRVKPELSPRPIPSPKSAAGAMAVAAAVDGADDTIDMEDTPIVDPKIDPDVKDRAKKKAGKGPKVPNFEKFRLRLIIAGAALVVLIVAWIVANIVLPKATITVATNSSNVNSSLTATLDSGVKTLDPTKLIVPATLQSTQKTNSQQVASSGQKNNGTPASGNVTMSAGPCGPTLPADVPAGNGLSANGLTFITQQDTAFVPVPSRNKCTFVASSQTPVTSQKAGAAYNIGPSSFSVAGRADVSASSSNPMTGGTDNIIKVVAQADIDAAKQKLTAQDVSAVKTDLQNSLQGAGLYAIPATFKAGDPNITTSANPGDQADNVTVTQVVTYTMFGVHQADLETLIKNDISKQIDTKKQGILDDGFSKASFNVVGQSGTTAQVTMQTTATAGPDLNVDALKKQIVGKHTGDIKSIIGANPGVTGVDVKFSPFWVSSVPKKLSKTTIIIEKPKVTANAKQ